jgi:hypothetical protein
MLTGIEATGRNGIRREDVRAPREPGRPSTWPRGIPGPRWTRCIRPNRRVAEIRRDVANIGGNLRGPRDRAAADHARRQRGPTNAILHACRGDAVDGDVRVLVSHADEFLDASICDAGVGMSPRADSPGLDLMAHEAHHCEIKSPPTGGTEVVLRFELPASRPHLLSQRRPA